MWHTAGTQKFNVIHDPWTYWFTDETLKRVESALLQSATPSASDTDINQSMNYWSIPSSQRLLSISIINHLVDLWEAISLWWLSSIKTLKIIHFTAELLIGAKQQHHQVRWADLSGREGSLNLYFFRFVHIFLWAHLKIESLKWNFNGFTLKFWSNPVEEDGSGSVRTPVSLAAIFTVVLLSDWSVPAPGSS